MCSSDLSSAQGASVTHTYTTAANYSVTVSATDAKGLSANGSLTVMVTNGTSNGSSSDTFTPGFIVTTLKGAFNLTPGKDSCAFTGVISNIPAGFNPNGMSAQLTFGSAGKETTGIEREGIRTWDFGDLPAQIAFTRAGRKLTGYPALADDIESVAIRLFDDPMDGLKIVAERVLPHFETFTG